MVMMQCNNVESDSPVMYSLDLMICFLLSVVVEPSEAQINQLPLVVFAIWK